MIPSVLKLKEKIYQFLSASQPVIDLATIAIAHPQTSSELQKGKGVVAITQLYDLQEGFVISPSLLYPWLQFACWDTSEPRSTRLLETVITCIESWDSATFSTPDQQVNSINRRRRNGPFFTDKVQLFVASVDVGFKLSTLGV